MHYGMVAQDRLDFLHYCSVRIQAAFRGFLGFLAFIESISKIILIQSMLAHDTPTEKVCYTY
jgi:hypothetical protein